MVPNSRGSAGLAALVAAAVVLLGSVWIIRGRRDATLEEQVRALRSGRSQKSAVSDGWGLLSRADALSKRLSAGWAAPGVPSGLRFFRPPPAERVPPPREVPPSVEHLEGSVVDSVVVLRWRAGGGGASGYRVERVGDDGRVLAATDLPAEARSWRSGPVDALHGARTYRVTALARDGSVAGAEQQRVLFREPFEVSFLGALANGRGRFRVSWRRAGRILEEVFPVSPSGEIGAVVGNLDYRTGWRFLRYGAKREASLREVRVPRFAADGTLMRDTDSGEVVYEVRTVSVVTIREGAEVLPAGTGGTGRWLLKVKD